MIVDAPADPLFAALELVRVVRVVALLVSVSLSPDVDKPLMPGPFLRVELRLERIDLRICAARRLVVVRLPVADVCTRVQVSGGKLRTRSMHQEEGLTERSRDHIHVAAPNDRLLGIQVAQIRLESAVPLFLLGKSLQSRAGIRYVCGSTVMLSSQVARSTGTCVSSSGAHRFR